MSYVLLAKDALSEAIENAFFDGRKYQSNRDEETLFARLATHFENSAEEIKDVMRNEFEEDAKTFSGGKELERRIACLEPETEYSPDLWPHQAQDKLGRIRELLATTEAYGGESKEKIETILSILCED